MQELVCAVGDATFGGEMLETVQETQNDEEEQALTSSQVWDPHRKNCHALHSLLFGVPVY